MRFYISCKCTGTVAGSRTLTNVSGSGFATILSTVAVGSGSPSAVGSGMRSAQRGDGGLGTGSGVDSVLESAVAGGIPARDLRLSRHRMIASLKGYVPFNLVHY